MSALGHHGCPEMMRTAGHIRDDLGLLRVRNARLEYADDRADAITTNAAEPDSLSNNRRIFPERVRPETISKHDNAGCVRTVIFRLDQAPEHGPQSHHFEKGTINHTAINFAWLAQAENGEGDR